MGTNFYRKRIITEEEKQILHQLLDNNDYSELQRQLCELSEEVHICKRSCGWKVGFDHNWGKYYQPNRKSLEEFLNEPNTVIVDEYGTKYTPEEFWDEVEQHNSNPRNTWTAKSYKEWEAKEYPNHGYNPSFSEEKNKCKMFFGIVTEDSDFTVDGLRFAVYTDFC